MSKGNSHASYMDSTKPVRPGEALDTSALATYLATHLEPATDAELHVEQFPKGHSNLTYLLRLGERELVLRRPPFGSSVQTAHDMGREYRILSALRPVYQKVPEPLLFCNDSSVIGAPFYIMERVRGVILRGLDPPAAAALNPVQMRSVCESLIDTLAELHAVDVDAAGLGDFGRPQGYVRRQVEGWARRYQAAKTDDVPEVDQMAAWLLERIPAERSISLVHNDFKYDNVVLSPDKLGQVVAVLDWELATVGDPVTDLATTLGYWIDADDSPEMQMLPFGPTMLPGNLNRAQVVARYAEVSDSDPGDLLYYYVFALLKIAGIAQQIYKRFVDGHTKDPRFAMMIMGVRILGKQGARALELGRIDRLG